jgi:hypothetical protein
MKPCKKNRKLIAWMILGELETAQREVIRAHLKQCEGCRAYFEEISSMSSALANGKTNEAVQASPIFHQKLLGKLRSEERRSLLAMLVEQMRWAGLKWRVGLWTTGGVVAVGLIVIFTLLRPVDGPAKRLESRQVPPELPSRDSMDPTLSNYEMVANLGPEKFDEFLTEQGTKNISSTPIYRASALPAEIGSD